MNLKKMLAGGIALILGMGVGLRVISSTNGPVIDSTPVARQVIVSQVQITTLTPEITLPATLKSTAEISVSSKMSGKVTAVYAKEGDLVVAGQLLFTVEQESGDSALLNQYTQAQIALSAAQTNLSNLQLLKSKQVAEMQTTIRGIENSIEYAKKNESLTGTTVESQIAVYEAQVNSASSNLNLAQTTLETTQSQTEQSVKSAKEQALSISNSALDTVDTVQERVNAVLGIDLPNFDPTYRDVLDNISSHIYLSRADDAYRTAYASYNSADSALDAVAAEDSTQEVQAAVDLAEQTISDTISLLDRMEELLSLQLNAPDYYDAIKAYKSELDGYQSSVSAQLLSVQAYGTAIESAELSAETSVAQAEAGVDVAQDGYDSAVAALAQVKSQSNSQTTGAESSVSGLEDQLDSAYNNLDIIKAQYDQQISAASYQVSLASAQVEQASIQVGGGSVTAPADGILADFNVTAGELISAGMPVATLVDPDSFEMQFSVSEMEVPYIKQGTAITITLDAYPEQVWKGIVYYVSPMTDAYTRTYPVKAYVNTEGTASFLVSGMSGQVTFTKGTVKKNVLAIPLEAVVFSTQLGDSVFVVTDGVAHETAIELGDSIDGWVEVKSGLSAGETVVIQGQNLLDDGDAVKIIPND
ncbi:MAG: efflux RND transporter periplasmic adaptor subunit [Candidatus Gracilibacteria bacterium]